MENSKLTLLMDTWAFWSKQKSQSQSQSHSQSLRVSLPLFIANLCLVSCCSSTGRRLSRRLWDSIEWLLPILQLVVDVTDQRAGKADMRQPVRPCQWNCRSLGCTRVLGRDNFSLLFFERYLNWLEWLLCQVTSFLGSFSSFPNKCCVEQVAITTTASGLTQSEATSGTGDLNGAITGLWKTATWATWS